eukprot:scaffold42099_cov60-Phaeocystis_antarctica.AAC.2
MFITDAFGCELWGRGGRQNWRERYGTRAISSAASTESKALGKTSRRLLCTVTCCVLRRERGSSVRVAPVGACRRPLGAADGGSAVDCLPKSN